MKVIAVGDLHLFSKRSNGQKIFDQLPEMISNCDLLVICGDLFDFRWSHFSSLKEGFEAAEEIMEEFLSKVTIPVAYILGNHDGVSRFEQTLERLKEKHDHFYWMADYLKVGNSVFLHGDIPLKTKGAKVTPRLLNENEPLYPQWISMGYAVFTKTGLIALYRIVKSLFRKTPLFSIDQAIDVHFEDRDIDHVVFGHTHFAIKEKIFNGRSYRNCGTPMRGFTFSPIYLEIPEASFPL